MDPWVQGFDATAKNFGGSGVFRHLGDGQPCLRQAFRVPPLESNWKPWRSTRARARGSIPSLFDTLSKARRAMEIAGTAISDGMGWS